MFAMKYKYINFIKKFTHIGQTSYKITHIGQTLSPLTAHSYTNCKITRTLGMLMFGSNTSDTSETVVN